MFGKSTTFSVSPTSDVSAFSRSRRTYLNLNLNNILVFKSEVDSRSKDVI